MHANSNKHGRAYRPRFRVSGVLSNLISFEVLFLLYFWAGRYKAIPFFTSFPIDVTVLFFLASLGAGIVVAYKEVDVFKTIQDQGMVVYVLFLIWILLTYLWSSQTSENFQKTIYTFTLINWSFLGTYLIISASPERARRFVIAIMVFSFSMIVYWFYVKFIWGIDIGLSSSQLVGPNYLGYGENALCLVLGFFALALKSKKIVKALLHIFTMIFIIVTMLIIGGKGPFMLSIFVPMVITIIIVFRNGTNSALAKTFQLILGVTLIAMVGVLIVLSLGYEFVETIRSELRTLDRLISTFGQGDFGNSATSRFDAQRIAIERWFEAPFFGWGIGEYSVLDGFLHYPHNLALEILMELGLVGFLLFVGLLGLALLRAWRVWPDDLSDWTTMSMCMLLMTMIISRFSFQGYLPDERFFFTLAGFVLGLGRTYNNLLSAARPLPKVQPVAA